MKREDKEYILHFISKTLVISFVVFLSLVTFCVGYLSINVAMAKSNNEIPLFGEYVILTESMVPTINVNDAVIVKRTNENKLGIGDIITFASSNPNIYNYIITHRVVGIQTLDNGNLVFRTKGDNNKLEDSALVEANKIYGKVILKLPKFGYVTRFLDNVYGIGFIILLAGFLLYLINFRNVNLLEKSN